MDICRKSTIDVKRELTLTDHEWNEYEADSRMSDSPVADFFFFFTLHSKATAPEVSQKKWRANANEERSVLDVFGEWFDQRRAQFVEYDMTVKKQWCCAGLFYLSGPDLRWTFASEELRKFSSTATWLDLSFVCNIRAGRLLFLDVVDVMLLQSRWRYHCPSSKDELSMTVLRKRLEDRTIQWLVKGRMWMDVITRS